MRNVRVYVSTPSVNTLVSLLPEARDNSLEMSRVRVQRDKGFAVGVANDTIYRYPVEGNNCCEA